MTYGNNQATAQQFTQLASSTSLANAQAVLGELYALKGTPARGVAPPDTEVTVGLVLGRASDPTSLLESSWAVRAQALADQAAVFATYGADPATYAATLAGAEAALGTSEPFDVAGGAIGYVSSAADRTVWLTLNATSSHDVRHPAPHRPRSRADRRLPADGVGRRSQPAPHHRWERQRPVGRSRTPADQSGGARSQRCPHAGGTAGHRQFRPLRQHRHRHARGDRRRLPFPPPAGVPTDPIALVETDIPSQASSFAALHHIARRSACRR